MTTRYLAFSGANERLCFRLCAAVDIELGYPRTHSRGEVTRHGLGPHAATVTTATKSRPRRLPDGRVVIKVDDAMRALSGRIVTVQDGGARQITISFAGEVEVGTIVEFRTATQLAPRGGISV